MIDRSNIWIVIPAFNEAERIAEVIRGIREHGFSNIVVVDDGSTDTTALIAQEGATVLRHRVGRGYGAALTTGTTYALERGAEVVVHFDGDGQFRASEISDVAAPLLRGDADITFGSRYLRKGSATPVSKRVLIHMPALAVQFLTTGLRFTDIHNGFRAITREAALRLRTRQDRMAYSSEIVNEVKRLRLRYVEVPVTIAYQEYGQGFAGGIRIYRDLLVKKLFR